MKTYNSKERDLTLSISKDNSKERAISVNDYNSLPAISKTSLFAHKKGISQGNAQISPSYSKSKFSSLI